MRPEGTERDKAGNRQLFYDQYCALQLLYLFNPIVTSLRGLQQASELKKVQRKLNCPRSSLRSLSEAVRVFDPELLREIVGELIEKLPVQEPQDRRLQDLAQALTAVDGTFLKTLPQITQACFSTRQDKGWQLHTHFEILRGIPVRMDLTDATGMKNQYCPEYWKKIVATFSIRHMKNMPCLMRLLMPAAAMSVGSVGITFL
ncbi:MAG: hypothetical protein CME32_30245 [Gimesia sp.]|uniref:hypothetical protein n=1 Tax=Gimesia TaxID=1649453 RepID=UPI000C4D152C|nr:MULTISPECIES: hypothetical protein [Gimesia]MAX36648.1 hypothetical protein [Gimesia sp.]MBN73555.1 hypothetical protein [Gimesia sp.]HAH46753.1 hypothetical protein [Planctomycetaceae bacterium]HAW29115.1 hypothetical protein [Planctomycetaceae bacterium]